MRIINVLIFHKAVNFLNIDRLEVHQRIINGTIHDLMRHKIKEKKILVAYGILHLLRERAYLEEDPSEKLFLEKMIGFIESFIYNKKVEIIGRNGYIQICSYTEFRTGEIHEHFIIGNIPNEITDDLIKLQKFNFLEAA